MNKSKTALVTGGGRGIGWAVAARLVEHGWQVAILDADARAGRRSATELGALFLRCDVSQEASVTSAVRRAVRELGGIGALVNNAGFTGALSGPVERLALKEWNRRIGTNLTGVFLMAKHCARHLRAARGAMVNIASTRAIQSEPHTESYSASKGGVVALTHALAISLGPEVRVNCVSPGWINTRGAKLRHKDHTQHPAGRVGRPEDIGEFVAWLLSDAAGFVTGQNFVADGGMTRKMIYEP